MPRSRNTESLKPGKLKRLRGWMERIAEGSSALDAASRSRSFERLLQSAVVWVRSCSRPSRCGRTGHLESHPPTRPSTPGALPTHPHLPTHTQPQGTNLVYPPSTRPRAPTHHPPALPIPQVGGAQAQLRQARADPRPPDLSGGDGLLVPPGEGYSGVRVLAHEARGRDGGINPGKERASEQAGAFGSVASVCESTAALRRPPARGAGV